MIKIDKLEIWQCFNKKGDIIDKRISFIKHGTFLNGYIINENITIFPRWELIYLGFLIFMRG